MIQTETVLYYIVCKFGNFYGFHILHESHFCKFELSKYNILTTSSPLKFEFGEFLHFVRAEID